MDSKAALVIIVLVLVLGGAYYWQQENQPVSQTPTASVSISLQAGGWGHCQNSDGTKSWKPRPDGKCYAADAPSQVGDFLHQIIGDRSTAVNQSPQALPPPMPRSVGFCLSTEDIPGVRHQAFYKVREWIPRADGLCYPEDAPAESTPVMGDDYRGGLLGCHDIGGAKSWLPRSDGLCYPLDLPQ